MLLCTHSHSFGLQGLPQSFYVTEWQSDSLGTSVARLPGSQMILKGQCLCLHSSSGSAKSLRCSSEIHASLAVLEVLQQTQGNVGSVRLASACKMRRGLASNSCSADSYSAAASAILKVAESEGGSPRSILITQQEQAAPLEIVSREARLNGNVVQSSRLLPAIRQPQDGRFEGLKAGSAIVSGGMGGLGLLTALWLSEQGLESLTLLGRSGRGGPDCALLFESSSALTMARCDVTSADESSAAVVGPRHRSCLVVHAGGVLADGMLHNQTLLGVRRVFAPKTVGLTNLERSTRVLGGRCAAYSSIAGVLGSAGQGNYAAANASLDARILDGADQVNGHF